MQINHQKPAIYNPVHLIPVTGQYEPVKALRQIMVDPLFVPLGSTPVDITDTKGNSYDEDSIESLFTQCLGDDVNTDAEDKLRELFKQGLVKFDQKSNMLANMVFVTQAANKVKPTLPCPSPAVIYTAATDVIPAAKSLLSDANHEDEFFASLGYTYSPETLGFWFQSEDTFKEFQNWFDNQMSYLNSANLLNTDTQGLIQKFNALKFNTLTEGLILRKDENDGNDEYSFPRLLIHSLMKYQEDQRSQNIDPTMGVMPFHLGELFIPKTVVFVNVEIHSRSSARKVDNEWKLINATISSGVRVISNKNLSKLTALPRAMAKAAAVAANSQSNKTQSFGRSANIRFRKRPPSKVNLLNGIKRALKRMKEVNRSQNIFKRSKTSFLKASRRDPDDYNRPGRIVSTHYLPDIHIYLDTSGSISVDNYEDTIKMLIMLAKKLNVNLYFNSFSHVMSQSVLLKTHNRSVQQIWQEFIRIPKVSGGTEYCQIWEYINMAKTRKERFSIIITDFEWCPPTQRVEHPRNLYYAPISVQSGYEWDNLIYSAKNFNKSMQHIEPAIAQRMIGVVV